MDMKCEIKKLKCRIKKLEAGEDAAFDQPVRTGSLKTWNNLSKEDLVNSPFLEPEMDTCDPMDIFMRNRLVKSKALGKLYRKYVIKETNVALLYNFAVQEGYIDKGMTFNNYQMFPGDRGYDGVEVIKPEPKSLPCDEGFFSDLEVEKLESRVQDGHNWSGPIMDIQDPIDIFCHNTLCKKHTWEKLDPRYYFIDTQVREMYNYAVKNYPEYKDYPEAPLKAHSPVGLK